MRVSVILPTLNAVSYLPALFERLKSQTIPPHEIIVVDSTSEDDTARVAKHLGANVLAVERSSYDHGGTRNYAVSYATGDLLVFITQDAIPTDDTFIEELIRPFCDPLVAAVHGRQVARPEADPIERMTREFNYPELPKRKTMADVKRLGIKTFFFSNVCSAIRRDVFDTVGGFPAPIILNEDMILAAKCLKQGFVIEYVPKARVIHSHHYSMVQQFRRNFDIGVSLRMNDWLLQYARPEKEGIRLVKTLLFRIARPGMWRLLPRWAAESVVKYTGYRMGLSYRVIPSALRAKCTMHLSFWN
jgi:rhamnosyltransferase